MALEDHEAPQTGELNPRGDRNSDMCNERTKFSVRAVVPPRPVYDMTEINQDLK